MFCGEITTNRRRLYRFRVFRIADLKTSQTKRFRGKFAKHGNKKNNSYRNIISYNSANAGEMSGPEMVYDRFGHGTEMVTLITVSVPRYCHIGPAIN